MSGEDQPQPQAQAQPQPTIVAIPPRPGEEVVPVAPQESVDALVDLPASASTPAPDTSNDAALAAALASAEEQDAAAAAAAVGGGTNPNYSVATCSSPWQYDDLNPVCHSCGDHFHPLLNRRHHCRLCGNVFCNSCSSRKALIPPSRIVLTPVGGKKSKPRPVSAEHVSFSPDPDPDRMLTYVQTQPGNSTTNYSDTINNSGDVAPEEQLLYGKGLEERFQLAREPLRVCNTPCYPLLQPLQEELRRHNSHAMRFNHIDPTDPRRLFNSPVAHTLGHEIRKAAYTLNNLLPQPKRRAGAFVSSHHHDFYGSSNNSNHMQVSFQSELQECKDTCSGMSPNLGDLDGVRIPAKLLEQAKGVAVMTVVKGGFGLAGVEFGTGLVVARLPATATSSSSDNNSNTRNDNSSPLFRWSAPSAIGTAGLSWGALIGAQVSDHVFLLMSDAAVALLYSNTASVQLGADIGVAVGPVGRCVEADWGVDGQSAAPIYTYSLSKGLYAGISLDGKVIVARPRVNEKFYGFPVTAQEILAGAVPTPPAAQPLYEALQRCHVYASSAASASLVTTGNSRNSNTAAAPVPEPSYAQEYGEVPTGALLPASSPPLARGISDQHSMGALSDVTYDF